MSNSNNFCITSNPDVSAIGVRLATYAQNFLTFVPVTYVLLDKKVTRNELKSLETQSTTILITAFGILLSTIVQTLASNDSLSNFHATIVLNLSWMNNTNTFIYFNLRLFHEFGENQNPDNVQQRRLYDWLKHTMKSLLNLTAIIGSLHLTFMAAVGIWLWSNPAGFGSSPPCSITGSIFVIGRRIPLSSQTLRAWSLFMYSILLIPGLNLIPPIAFFLVLCVICERFSPPKSTEDKMLFVIAGLLMLALVDILLVADIEAALGKNDPLYLEPGDAPWSFGQILALLVTARDTVEIAIEHRAIRRGKEVLAVIEREEPLAALAALKSGAILGSNGIECAARKGYIDIVKYLVEKKSVSVTYKGTTGVSTALHEAAENGHLGIVRYLAVIEEDSVNATDCFGRTALHIAAENGHFEIVQYLVRDQRVHVHLTNNPGRTALDLALLGNHSAVETFLREKLVHEVGSAGIGFGSAGI